MKIYAPVLTEAARTSSRSRVPESKSQVHDQDNDASSVLKHLEQHVLLDGFKILIALLEKSHWLAFT